MVMGPGAARQTGEEAKALGISAALLVHDPNLPESCVRVVKESLEKAGIRYECFTGVEPDCPDYTIQAGYEFAKNIDGLNGIICLGGGSGMDTAKGINVILNNPGKISDYYSYKHPDAGFMGAAKNPGYPLILIPTTAGTGSEQGKSAVIHDSETGMKSPVLSTTCCFAKLAIIDPEMTVSCPPGLTAITALDAFTHAYEAYTGDDEQPINDVSPLSDLLAEEAMRLIAENLPRVLTDLGNMEYRYKLAYASTIAMKAVANAHSHLGHCFAHAIGGVANVPHGVACWICDSHLAPWISDVHYKKNKKVAEILGADVPADASPEVLSNILYAAMRDFGLKVGLPGFKHYGVTRAQVISSLRLMKDDYLFRSGKKPITEEQALEILKEICDAEGLK